jgi:hypothetical protein
LVYSLTNPVELADRQDDHAMQALAYGLQARPQAPRVERVEPWRDVLRLDVGEDGKTVKRVKPPGFRDWLAEAEAGSGRRFTFHKGKKTEAEL